MHFNWTESTCTHIHTASMVLDNYIKQFVRFSTQLASPSPSQSHLGSPPRPLLKEERNPRHRAFKSKCTKFAITWHRLVQKSQPAVIPASSSVVWVLLNAQVDAAWVCHSRGHKWEILCGGACTLIFTFTLSSYTIFQPLEMCFFSFLAGREGIPLTRWKNTGRDTRLHSRGLHFFDVAGGFFSILDPLSSHFSYFPALSQRKKWTMGWIFARMSHSCPMALCNPP